MQTNVLVAVLLLLHHWRVAYLDFHHRLWRHADARYKCTPLIEIVRYYNHLITKRRRSPPQHPAGGKRAEEDGDMVDAKIIRYTDDLTTKWEDSTAYQEDRIIGTGGERGGGGLDGAHWTPDGQGLMMPVIVPIDRIHMTSSSLYWTLQHLFNVQECARQFHLLPGWARIFEMILHSHGKNRSY